MAADDVTLIGDWESVLVKQRRSSTGRSRTTLEVVADPVLVDLNEQRLGQPIAEAIAEQVRASLLASQAMAAPSTVQQRGAAARAYAAGKPWAKRAYGGGKIGGTPPNPSSLQKGVDSGRLAKSLVMRFVPSAGMHILNVAANRLGPEFRERRPEFVPWLITSIVQPSLSSERVSKAVHDSLGDAIVKVADGRAAARKRLVDNARALLDAGRGLADEFGSEFGDDAR